MLGEKVPAPKALEWGLINRVLAGRRAAGRRRRSSPPAWPAGPTRSYAGSKRQLNAWSFARFDAQLELEATIQHEAARTADFLEGVTAFVEKRAPRFSGS